MRPSASLLLASWSTRYDAISNQRMSDDGARLIAMTYARPHCACVCHAIFNQLHRVRPTISRMQHTCARQISACLQYSHISGQPGIWTFGVKAVTHVYATRGSIQVCYGLSAKNHVVNMFSQAKQDTSTLLHTSTLKDRVASAAS